MMDVPDKASQYLPGQGGPPAVPRENLHFRARILLAEDNADHQQLFSLVLQSAGAEVMIAADGRTAYELALGACSAGSPFDLILMDVRMPELDGHEVAARLRKARYTGPIIAVTACAMVGDCEKCLAAGCDDYAAKPISPVDLLRIVSRHLCQRVP